MRKGRSRARTEKELESVRRSGWITAAALKKIIESVRPGISLVELDRIGEEEIKRLGGQSSFKTVPGYFWTTCLTLNEEVVHGLPRQIKLQEGDVLGIDLGAVYQGWHTDAAWSVLVQNQEEKKRFLKVGERTLWESIGKAVEGNRIGDISATIQAGIERAGFSVVKSLAGHGVGRSAHEEPEIPEFGKVGQGRILKKGMTLAIEVIYTEGNGEVITREDGWTIAAADRHLGGLFEMTVIVGKEQPEIITDWRKV